MFVLTPAEPTQLESRLDGEPTESTRCRDRVTEGRAGQIIETLHALAPSLYGKTLPYFFERAVFTSGPVEMGPGNVFEPIPEQNRVSDGWGRTNTALWQASLAGGAAVVGAAEAAYALLRRGR